MSSLNFPIDILRCIIEFAVWNDYRTAQSLELVSHAFRIWTGPAFYKTISLHSASLLIGFSELVRAAPEPSLEHATAITRDTEFYANHVRHISIHKPKVPSSVLDPIFSVCLGIVTLELEGVEAPLQAPSSLRELIFPTLHLSFTTPSLFVNLTHLWSNMAYHYEHLTLPAQLSYLALLNIVTDLSPNTTWVAKIQQLPHLKLFVFNIWASRTFAFVPEPRWVWDYCLHDFCDERIVVRRSSLFGKETESEIARRTGVSIWTVALLDGETHPDLPYRKLTRLESS